MVVNLRGHWRANILKRAAERSPLTLFKLAFPKLIQAQKFWGVIVVLIAFHGTYLGKLIRLEHETKEA